MRIPSVGAQVPEVLRRLRALRGDLEYYVEPDGWILLLAWDPTAPRVREAEKMLGLGLDTLDNRLMADGFSILAMCEPHAVWSGELLQVAQNIIDQSTPKKVDAVHRARLLEADGTMETLRGEAHLRDALTSESRSDHRIFFRGKRSFSGASFRHRGVMDLHINGVPASVQREREFVAAARLMKRFPNIPLVR